MVVENSGFGATWAAPIAWLLMEKYLNDTLRTERLKQVDYIAGSNLMPDYLDRLQYIEDSTRAFKWFEMTRDSNYIRKYLKRGAPYIPKKDRRNAGTPKKNENALLLHEEILFDNRHLQDAIAMLMGDKNQLG